MYKFPLIILVCIGYIAAESNNPVNQQQNYVSSCREFLKHRIPTYLDTPEMTDYFKELETISACTELLKFEHCAKAENASSNDCTNYTIKEGFFRQYFRSVTRRRKKPRLINVLTTIKTLTHCSQEFDSTFEYLRSLRTNKPRL